MLCNDKTSNELAGTIGCDMKTSMGVPFLYQRQAELVRAVMVW
jgi:hypothetical protein